MSMRPCITPGYGATCHTIRCLLISRTGVCEQKLLQRRRPLRQMA